MKYNYFYFLLTKCIFQFQGPQGPPGPAGEPGIDGAKVMYFFKCCLCLIYFFKYTCKKWASNEEF